MDAGERANGSLFVGMVPLLRHNFSAASTKGQLLVRIGHLGSITARQEDSEIQD